MLLLAVPFNRPDRLDDVLDTWARQTVQVPLVLVANERGPWSKRAESEGAVVLTAQHSIGGAKNAALEYCVTHKFPWVAFCDDDNYYGPKYLEQIKQTIEAPGPEPVAVTQGIAFVRDGDNLWWFDRPLAFCPGHCTAIQADIAPDFPEYSLGEDLAWSRKIDMGRVRRVPPWYSVYDRTGEGHAYEAPFVEFLKAFEPGHYIGPVDNEFVNEPCDLTKYAVVEADEEDLFRALERRSKFYRGPR